MELIRRHNEMAYRKETARSQNVTAKKGTGMMTVKSGHKKKIQFLSPGARGNRSPPPGLPRAKGPMYEHEDYDRDYTAFKNKPQSLDYGHIESPVKSKRRHDIGAHHEIHEDHRNAGGIRGPRASAPNAANGVNKILSDVHNSVIKENDYEDESGATDRKVRGTDLLEMAQPHLKKERRERDYNKHAEYDAHGNKLRGNR